MSLVLSKRRTASAIGLAVVMVAVSVAGSASPAYSAPDPKILGAGAPESIPGRYTVVLKDTPSLARSGGVAARAQSLTQKHRGTVTAVYEKSLTGFSVAMSEDEAKQLAADPSVDYVEQARAWHLADSQDSPPQWGLDRIDQRALPLDAAYSYDLAPQPATVYVIDTGVRISHTEFGGRARNGRDTVNNDAVAEDCHGHGTHVAGTVAGSTYGVAKGVRVVAVRVFDCSGTATADSIPKGIEWVINNAVRPAVINMSIGMICRDPGGNPAPCSVEDGRAIRTQMQNAIGAGIHLVAAAGNDDTSACNNVVAQAAGTVVVGASRAVDARPTYSNWGPCVDIWAPGGDDPPPGGGFCVPAGTPNYAGITSAGIASDTATCQISGTSMAAPHVAGAVALILARPGWSNKTTAEVKTQLLAESTLNVLTGINGGSPNKLLYTAPPPPGAGSSIALARHQNGLLEMFGVNGAGNMFRRTQNGVGSISWLGWNTAVDPSWYSVCAQTDNTPAITLFGLHRGRTAWHRRQAVVNGDAWSGWQGLDKNLTSCGAALNSAGMVEVFGSDAQGRIFRTVQTAPGASTYAASTDIGFGQAVRAVAAERNANNQVEVFALTRTGEIWHCWQTASCGPGNWFRLDGLLQTIALARNANGSLALFGVNHLGQLFHRNAGSGTNTWGDWSRPPLPAAMGTPRSLAAEADPNGRITVVAVNTAGHIWQTSVNGSAFGPWSLVDGLLRP